MFRWPRWRSKGFEVMMVTVDSPAPPYLGKKSVRYNDGENINQNPTQHDKRETRSRKALLCEGAYLARRRPPRLHTSPLGRETL